MGFKKTPMHKVDCTVEEVELENDEGRKVPGVTATCSQCDHKTDSFGRAENSVKRCMVLMRDECPMGEVNFYEAKE